MFLMTRRTALKWLHWLTAGLMLYFLLVEPEAVERLGNAALATHAGTGVLFSLTVLLWLWMYLRRGLASRPGPKLPGWARVLHPLSHKALQWGLVAMALSGLALALLGPFVVMAFGILPIAPALDIAGLHDLAEEAHELIFNGLLLAILAHTAFHLWRHYVIRDNALRIMAPKALHRWL